METTNKGIWVPTEIWENEDLRLIEKMFMVKIDALDGEKGCYASNRYFSEFFKLSKSRCSAIIKNLKDKGYIAIHYAYEEGKNVIERRVIKVKKAICNIVKTTKEFTKKVGKNKKFQNDESEEIKNEIECLELSGTRRKRSIEKNIVDLEVVEDEIIQMDIDNLEDELSILDIDDGEKDVMQLDVFGEETNVENIKYSSSNNKSKPNKGENNRNEDKKNNENEENKNLKKEMYEEIIGYLNIKCNKNFKYTTGKTVRCINARLREGNTVDDFKTVIDKKFNEWSNTTMKMYLRPETLFGSKFERYLTENVKDRENHFKKSSWTGGQARGKQFKNARNSGENKESEERIRFGNLTPLTAEEIEWAERELF